MRISLYRSIHQRIDRFEKTENFSILFKESDYRFVQSRERLVAFVLTGIVHRTAIKNITTAIARRIIGNPFLVSKTHYFNSKLPFFKVIGKLLEFGEFA